RRRGAVLVQLVELRRVPRLPAGGAAGLHGGGGEGRERVRVPDADAARGDDEGDGGRGEEELRAPPAEMHCSIAPLRPPGGVARGCLPPRDGGRFDEIGWPRVGADSARGVL